MKVGHTKLIDVNISGEPVPEVTWSFKDAVRFVICIQVYVIYFIISTSDIYPNKDYNVYKHN